MTKIITRLFPDQASAQKVADRLLFKGVPKNAVDVIADGGDTAAALVKARVDETAVAPYAKAIGSGNAALVVRATYKPLGVAQMTRDLLASRETVPAPAGVIEEHQEKDLPEPKGRSILSGHPHMLTIPASIAGSPAHGPVTGGMGMSLLKSRRHKNNLMDHDRRMSRMFWPMPLLSRKERSRKVMSGTRYMSQTFWPMPLISHSTRRRSVLPDGTFQLSRIFGWRMVS